MPGDGRDGAKGLWRRREIERKCYKNKGIMVEAPGIEPIEQCRQTPIFAEDRFI